MKSANIEARNAAEDHLRAEADWRINVARRGAARDLREIKEAIAGGDAEALAWAAQTAAEMAKWLRLTAGTLRARDVAEAREAWIKQRLSGAHGTGWIGACLDCGATASDTHTRCLKCDQTFCSDCVERCVKCGSVAGCVFCFEECGAEGCGGAICGGCAWSCERCCGTYCFGHLEAEDGCEDDLRCEGCHGKEVEKVKRLPGVEKQLARMHDADARIARATGGRA